MSRRFPTTADSCETGDPRDESPFITDFGASTLPKQTTDYELSHREARNLILDTQGLAGKPGAEVAETVESRGFVRTLGGVDVYLAIRERCPGTTRSDIDAAVEDGDTRIVPAARGCIYLVARSHATSALGLAKRLSARRNERDQKKAGIHPGELAELGELVLECLARGARSTTELRREIGDGIRSLGDAGKKVGLSSTLPPTLRDLELELRIERRPANGRLDNERYVWQLSDPDRDGAPMLQGDTEIDCWIADLFFRWSGVATEKAFFAWSGLGARDARRAMAACDLASVSIRGLDGTYWAHGDLRPLLDQPSSVEKVSEAIAFLPFEDNLVAHQQGPAFWVDAEHHGLAVPVWGRGKGSTLGDARHSSLRPVIAEGRMVGFWELDPDSQDVFHTTFASVSTTTGKRLAEHAARLASFLRQELGHGRSFSLDTEKAMRRRVEHLRALG